MAHVRAISSARDASALAERLAGGRAAPFTALRARFPEGAIESSDPPTIGPKR
jgi:hypothetical protein